MIPIEQDQERRERRLGHVQLAPPAAGCAAPAGPRRPAPGRRRSRRGRARGRRPLRAICVPAPARSPGGRLQRRHVVDAVADHRHVAARAGERLHDAALALGRDPPDDARRVDERAQRGGVAREARCRRATRSTGMPASRAIGGHRRRVVAGEHLQLDPCERRKATVSRVSARSSSASTTRQRRCRGGGGSPSATCVRQVARRGRERQHAAPVVLAARARPRPAGPGRRARAPRARSSCRRARRPPQRRPRRERHLGLRLDAVAGPVARDGGERQVPVRCRAPRSGASSESACSRSTPAAGITSTTCSARLGQRAGLVQADRSSTDASDSIAFSCWASTPRRAIRTAATA